jgi:PAS domain S-box-containing protein
VLSHAGHRVLEAANGRDALAVVRAEHPDLVITDVLMPTMDGYAFVQALRLDPAIAGTAVIFHTGHYAEAEARALAFGAGVAAFLEKPAAAAQVVALVARVLGGWRDAPAAPAAPAFEHDHLRLITDKLSATAGDLRYANARLRALVNLGLELAAERDLDRLLHRVAGTARDLFAATSVTVGIVDDAGETLLQAVTCGAEVGCHPGDRVHGILARVVRERRVLRGEHAGGDPEGAPLTGGPTAVRAYLTAPVASPTRVYGWICLVRDDGRAFSDDDEPLVASLSGVLGRIYEVESEIVERRLVEQELRRERDRSQRYLDTADVILLALDCQRRVTVVNRKACDLLGWTEGALLGREWITTCVPERLREEVAGTLVRALAGDLPVVENHVLTRAGGERLIEWRNTVLHEAAGVLGGTLSSGADVTEQRMLQQEYQQAQKMEAIGRLAGGVAHDFNNLLTVILGNCELLRVDFDECDPRRADVAEIARAAASASALTRQLLMFSRRQVVETAPLELNAVVDGVRLMLERLLGSDVRVVLRLKEGLGIVMADRGQIEQVVMNLAVNARDAMPHGGTLTIETAHAELDDSYVRAHQGAEAGSYVALTVTDTGTGMTPEAQAKLFEPFFTTKGRGKGTGLGLATVHGIVVGGGGIVAVRSQPGAGTSFTVYLPRTLSGGVGESDGG